MKNKLFQKNVDKNKKKYLLIVYYFFFHNFCTSRFFASITITAYEKKNIFIYTYLYIFEIPVYSIQNS